MLTLFVVDRSAEARAKLVAQVNAYLQADLNATAFLPQMSLKPLSIEELKFHQAPDVCIVGEEVVAQDIRAVAQVRRLLSETTILVRLSQQLQDMNIIEQLARFGVDDVISVDAGPQEFVRKLVLLAQGRRKPRSGKLLLVAGGKGGVGVTSVAAALGECLASRGKRCAVLDFDFETQDLSRFLQTRPFLNENLQLLFNGQRPVTRESVEQCLVPVWDDAMPLFCMPPIPESDSLYSQPSGYPRTLLSVLQVLDALFEYVIVDIGCVAGALLRAFLRAADGLLFVVNNDPASLYAGVDRVGQFKTWLAPNAELTLVENAPARRGLSQSFLRKEFTAAAQLPDTQRFIRIPLCPAGARWPASGSSLYGASSGKLVRAVNELTGMLDEPPAEKTSLFSAFRGMLGSRKEKPALPATIAAAALPQLTPALPPGNDWEVTSLVSGAQLGGEEA